MKIAVTGAAGRVGRAIVAHCLDKGHSIVALDRSQPDDFPPNDALSFIRADTDEYDALVAAFAGCDAVIHMAAIPSPFQFPDHVVHNNNVVGSYNAMRAAVENGIMRICQASSVNAIGFSFSREPHYEYFPIDENHPNSNEEAYGLSKWICEAQADSFARRYEAISIASMRFHWVVPDRATGAEGHNAPGKEQQLWAYTLFTEAARACLMSLEAPFTGHEAFYIVAPRSTSDVPSLELAERFYPNVAVRGDLSGHRGFFDCSKAARILGWIHED